MPDKYHVTTPAAGVSVPNGTNDRTILQITAPSGRRPRLCLFQISTDDGAPTDDAIRVRLERQTSAGTSGDTATPVRKDPDAPAASVTALSNIDGTAPTAGDIIDDFYLPTAGGGLYERPWPEGDEEMIDESGRIGVVVSTGAQTRVVRAKISWEE